MTTFETELVGRDEELEILRHWWNETHHPALVVHGSRGVGKTAVVTGFARQLARAGADVAFGDEEPGDLRVLDDPTADLQQQIARADRDGYRLLATTGRWDAELSAVRLRLSPLSVDATDGICPALEALIGFIRARDLRFQPSDTDLATLRDIAVELDGVPYELACAARFCRVISFDELFRVVRRDRFSIVSGKGADLWPRLEEEWAALPNNLRRAATRLPAAGKTFDLAGAASVLDVERFEAAHVLEGLDAHAWVESTSTSGEMFMRESYRLFALEKAGMRDSMATGLVDRSLRAATDDNGARHALNVLESIAPRIMKSGDAADIYRFRVAHSLLTWRLHGPEKALESLPPDEAAELRGALELASELEGSPDAAAGDPSRRVSLLNNLLRALPRPAESTDAEQLSARAVLTLLSASDAPFERAAVRAVRNYVPRALFLEVSRDVLDPDRDALVVTPSCDVVWLEGEHLDVIERSPNLQRFLAAIVDDHLATDGWCTTDTIVERIWPDGDADAVSNRLYVAASRLRSSGLGDELETERGSGYRIAPTRRVVIILD